MIDLDFDLGNVTRHEFGVQSRTGGEPNPCLVPTGSAVLSLVLEIARNSLQEMQQNSEGPRRYEPSEKYASREYVTIPLDDPLASEMRLLRDSVPPDCRSTIDEIVTANYYFVRFYDASGRTLLGIRRNRSFKSLIRNTLLLRWIDDTLQPGDDNIVRLDKTFDCLVDSKTVHILHADTFIRLTNQQQRILDSALTNIAALRAELPYLHCDVLDEYATTHPRAAAYLAAIVTSNRHRDIVLENLRNLCRDTGIDLQEEEGRLILDKKDVLGFLQVLDRRRYRVELTDNNPEHYLAPSRRPLSV